MKTDPNNHCVTFKQSIGWAVLHDLLAHPLMALTGYCKLSVAFHNYTSSKAWVRDTKKG